MLRSLVVGLFVGLCVLTVAAEEPKLTLRQITEAESVLAVYREDWGRASRGGPAMFLAAWPDGHIVWSGDRLEGGPPYRAGRVDPMKLTALLARLEKDGLFADEKLGQAHFGPDSQFTTVFIKSGKKQLKMQSWHELFEASGELVVDQSGVSALDGRRRLDVLRKAPADYLFFRTVWSETSTKLADLIPRESRPSGGRLVMKAGVLSWQEPAATPDSNGAADPPKR